MKIEVVSGVPIPLDSSSHGRPGPITLAFRSMQVGDMFVILERDMPLEKAKRAVRQSCKSWKFKAEIRAADGGIGVWLIEKP